MNKLKKLLYIFILLMTVFVVGCNNDKEDDKGDKPLTEAEIIEKVNQEFAVLDSETIKFTRNNGNSSDVNTVTFLSVNDFHGALEASDGEFGAARMGGYIISRHNENPNGTVLLSAGDMFQGTGISNYRHGRDTLTFMNALGFDAMSLGNHEFDWTLDEVLKYLDGNKANGEASFPFLGCNVIDTRTNELPEHILPYTIIVKNNVRIGIVGYIGYGLEDSIATKMVENYKFLNPIDIVGDYAEKLRTIENCDLVIALGHDDNSTANSTIANFTGDRRVDGIFNGHSHSKRSQWINTSDGRRVPVVQGGSSGECVSEISFTLKDTGWEATTAYYHKMDNVAENTEIKNYVSRIVNITSLIFKRVLTYAGSDIDKYATIDWAVDSLRAYTNTDVAFINDGGIRADAFPINKGQEVKVENVYRIMPFDNTVKTVTLTGEQIISLTKENGISYSSSLTQTGSTWYINGKELSRSATYRVAAIDYIFDKTGSIFLKGTDIVSTGILFRDVLIETLEEIGLEGKWTI